MTSVEIKEAYDLMGEMWGHINRDTTISSETRWQFAERVGNVKGNLLISSITAKVLEEAEEGK